MFTLIIEDKHGGIADEYSFEEGEFYIGRSHTSDIILPSDNVSRRHARLYTVDGRCYIEDLNSSNGVFVNGRKIHEVYQIQRSAQVKIGDYYLHIESDEDGFQAEEDRTYCRLSGRNLAFTNQVFRVQRKVNLVGRGKDCSITIIDPSVSRIHSKLTVERSGALTLEDLKSSNGTFVNDDRIEIATLNHGDVVRFGNVEFLLEVPDAPSVAAPAPRRAERQVPAPAPRAPAHAAAAVQAAPPAVHAAAPPQPTGARYSTVSASYADEDWGARQKGGRTLWLVLSLVGGLLVLGGIALAIFGGNLFSESEPAKPIPVVETTPPVDPEKVRREAEKAEADGLFKEAVVLGLQEEKWDAAIEKLERVMTLAPTNSEARGQLNAFKDYREDAQQLAEARELANQTKRGPAANLLRKVIQDRTSPYRDDAQTDLQNLMAYKPMMLKIAENKLKQRECAEALEQLKDVRQLDPHDVQILSLIQDVESKQGTRRCND